MYNSITKYNLIVNIMYDLLYQRIKIIYDDSGKTMEDFVKPFGFKPSNMYAIMQGRVKSIGSEVLETLCAHYNVNPIWLLEGKGNKYKGEGDGSSAENESEIRQALNTAVNEIISLRLQLQKAGIKLSVGKSKGADFKPVLFPMAERQRVALSVSQAYRR